MSMKMTMAEFVGLEPCPFCGGEAEMLTAESMNGGYLFGIMCNDCRSRGDVYDTEAEAIAAWNSRSERTCKLDRNDVCNVCGACIQRITHSVYEMGDSFACYPNYCPNCGCKVVDK